MNLAAFFAQIAPQLGTTKEQLLAYASEDKVGGFLPDTPNGWVVGSVWEVEGQALYAIVRALKPQRMLEIGTRRGCSTTHILTALAANGTGELVSLDLLPFLGDIPEPLQHRWTFVQTDALQWVRQQQDTFDVVFEDGAHSYEFTRDVLRLCQKFSARLTISHDAAHFMVGADIRAAWEDVYGAGMFSVALIDPADCGFSFRFAAPVRAMDPNVTPLVSIVSGTYNRIDYLMAMVESVRRQMPLNVAYEFIIVDGGSTDGTESWCALQPDIRFIQQGELLGAIRAFDAGAEAARGEYVLLVNDDVLVANGAILRAVAHLESHPDCGAVAFADDRKAPGYEAEGYHVQTIRGIRDGNPVNIVYAQVGLFRRRLGDAAGWWGSRDSDWGNSHTYGGDARLSGRLWELGYTVDAVEGVTCHDRVAPDDLRQRNHAIETQIGSAFYRKYPDGVYIASQPQPHNPQPEQLRILLATLYDRGFGHYKHGLRDALSKVGRTVEVDYLAAPEQLVRMAWAWQPHLIVAQMCDPDLMRRVREYAPSAVIVNWNGDIYPEVLLSPQMLTQCRYTDLQLVVNADVLPAYQARGIAADYWQVSFEPVETVGKASAHDVLFMGNNYSPERAALGAVLRSLPHNVGIYGMNWADADGATLYQFDAGAALLRRCKIAIGDNQWKAGGFVSNRLFETMANGAFLLHQAIPGVEDLLGLQDGVHLVFWSDFDDLKRKVAYYLNPKHRVKRQKIAAAGEAFIREKHSFDARVTELFEELLPRLDKAEADAPRRRPDDLLTPVGVAVEWEDGIPR